MEGEMSEPYRLVEQEIPRLRRYARALTRSGDRADDLVQDTLVRALSKAHLWQAGTDIRAWLFTIMHNQHVNTVRRASREQRTVDIRHVLRDGGEGPPRSRRDGPLAPVTCA